MARFETGRRRDIVFQARRRIIFDISDAGEPLAEYRQPRARPEVLTSGVKPDQAHLGLLVKQEAEQAA